jgi:hypothetical protein
MSGGAKIVPSQEETGMIPWLVVDSKRGVIMCTRCGKGISLPAHAVPAGAFVRLMESFEVDHIHCPDVTKEQTQTTEKRRLLG